jgi:hypothetical protein
LNPRYWDVLSATWIQRCIVGVLVIWCWLDVPGRVRDGRREKMKVEKLTALEAYRAGKLHLAPGYELEHVADVLLLRRDDGSVVATFSARGATPSEVVRTAEEDYRTHGKNSA